MMTKKSHRRQRFASSATPELNIEVEVDLLSSMGVKVSVNVLYQIFAAFTGTTGWAKKRGHSLSEKKIIGEYLAKLQARM